MLDEFTGQDSDLQEPLCGPEVDCRGLDFMPLDVARLRDSDLVAISSGEGFKAAVLLWAKSWWEIPAGSLLNNDRALARAAGISEREFQRVKSEALHGWILCSDGRLYHPLIVDFALKAAKNRRDQAARANSRWAKEKAKKAVKSARAKSPRESAGDAAAYAGAMQGRGRVNREGKESLPESETPTLRAIDGGRVLEVFTDTGNKFEDLVDSRGDTLEMHLVAESKGEKSQERDPEVRARLREAACWFMAVGVLRVIDGLEEAAARKIVAQLLRNAANGDTEVIARAALATWRAATTTGLRRAQPYFAQVVNSEAGAARLRM